MTDDRRDGRLARFVKLTARRAGRQFEEARSAYREGRTTASLPTDEAGRVRIVCRRYAERRAVLLDDADRPACYDAGNPDCEGCVEDIASGRIETWEPSG